MSEVNDILRELRKKQGISQEELGARMGSSQRHVWQIENGTNPLLSTLVRYLDGLGIDLAELLRGCLDE